MLENKPVMNKRPWFGLSVCDVGLKASRDFVVSFILVFYRPLIPAQVS